MKKKERNELDTTEHAAGIKYSFASLVPIYTFIHFDCLTGMSNPSRKILVVSIAYPWLLIEMFLMSCQ